MPVKGRLRNICMALHQQAFEMGMGRLYPVEWVERVAIGYRQHGSAPTLYISPRERVRGLLFSFGLVAGAARVIRG